jgi:hypothetical protein
MTVSTPPQLSVATCAATQFETIQDRMDGVIVSLAVLLLSVMGILHYMIQCPVPENFTRTAQD